MVLKIFGMGIKGYLSDSFNIFDGLIVIISVVEYSLGNNSEVLRSA